MELKADAEERREQVFAVLEDTESTQKDIKEVYNVWVPYIEEDMAAIGYQVDEFLEEFVSLAGTRDRKSLRVLDVAAGTGLIGAKLRDLGFTNIDALDQSAEMLAHARHRGVYRNFYHVETGVEPIQGVENGVYDLMISSAAICGQHHVTMDHVESLSRLVKPGGYMFLLTTVEWLGDFRAHADAVVRDMEARGVVRRMREPETDKPYFMQHSALTYILQVL